MFGCDCGISEVQGEILRQRLQNEAVCGTDRLVDKE